MSFPPRVPSGSDITVHTLTATGQIISTLATGTAPLVIASTTNIPNLNASLLGGKTFAAPAAIGSGTPAAITATAMIATTYNGNTLTTGSSTYTGTAAQTYTFPTTTATIARTDAAQTFTGVQTFSSAPIIPGFSSSSTGSTALSANSTQIQLAVRNTSTGNAAQARIDWGNNSGASAGTIGLYGSNHATRPAYFEMINQANAPLVLGANGNDVLTIAGAGGGSFAGTLAVGGSTLNVSPAAGFQYNGSAGKFMVRTNGQEALFVGTATSYIGSNDASSSTNLIAAGNPVITLSSTEAAVTGNLTVGVGTAGATAANVLCLSNSATAPTTSVDRCQLYCKDISAGNAALAIYQEMAPYAGIAVASTTKIPIIVNGVTYYILATTVA